MYDSLKILIVLTTQRQSLVGQVQGIVLALELIAYKFRMNHALPNALLDPSTA